MPEERKFLRLDEVASLLRCSAQIVRKQLREGSIPERLTFRVKPKGPRLFHADRLAAWIEARSAAPAAPVVPAEKGAGT